MLIKWETLLIAVALAGGSVLIENSHRIDTGTPDDDVVATAPAACIDTRITASLADGDQSNAGDEGSQVARESAPTPPALPACSDE